MRISASRSDCRNSCGPVEVAHPDPHRAEPLGDVRVRAGAGDDPVLGGEAHRLVVEGADRHARVEDLDRVDVVEDAQQVLVVGHRVHAVERVRHVDERRPGADLGDRLAASVSPRGIFSSMNRPITSPWLAGLDLLADDHLDAVASRPPARAPRARRRSRCGRSPRSRRGPARAPSRAAPRPASRSRGEWSVCMCRSTSISGRCGERAAQRRVARGRVAARGERARRSRSSSSAPSASSSAIRR